MFKVIALGGLLSATCPVFAEINLRFEPAEHYTDLALSGSATPSVQADLIRQFDAHFRQLAKQFLADGQRLDIVIEDIDLAGAYEPWRTPDAINTRFIRDIYPPRITLHYQWFAKDGQLQAEKREKLTDLNYLMHLNAARYQNYDPLRYEKAMLERWFEAEFSNKTGD